MPTSGAIRQQFIDFFVSRCGHTLVPSSPVVPHDDPTLLFANAGMNQFKDVFLALGTRPYRRVVNTQKCIRAGGKHNDLEDVGKDTYHHTFFEMLGNWSFGDYFKREAIGWAWELLTKVWGLDKSRLYATVFGGDEGEGLAPDEETERLWREVTNIDPSHISRWAKKDNFWEMGESGPCGPCTEIHIDRTPDGSGGPLVNRGDPRVIELWNLVFIQFNRDTAGRLTPLPARHVDTGMGFERLCAVLQGKMSNYDTDVFTSIFDAIREVTGAPPYTGSLDRPSDIAYRVIADHIRTLTFAVADGAVPGSEGRDYVLRRILRRAVRHGRQTLGVTRPFFHRLVPVVAQTMGGVFPELTRDPHRVAQVIRDEEEQFSRTIDRGLGRFEQIAATVTGGGRTSGVIAGADAFELESTFGFPIDLTQVMAQEHGLSVDRAGYEECRRQHQRISRSGQDQTDAAQALVEIVQKSTLPETDFVGYDQLSLADARLCGAWDWHESGRWEPAEAIPAGRALLIVTDRTPFYAEAGGQVGDRGVLRSHQVAFRVEDTRKVGNVYFHLGVVEEGVLTPRAAETVWHIEVDQPRRRKIMLHHTATHLLNHRLRAVLGDHVQQKGSLVDDEKTRFDFSHPRALGIEEIERIERLVNEDVSRDLPVFAGLAPQEDALRIHGLRAVFGEKYPPIVRVVSIGVGVDRLLAEPGNVQWYDHSIEFCGGTHVASTSPIGRFVIASEEAVAKGVRRLTAVAGSLANDALFLGQELLERARALEDAEPARWEGAMAELTEAVASSVVPLSVKVQIRGAIDRVRKRLKQDQKQQRKQSESDLVAQARQIAEANQGPIVIAQVEGAGPDGLRTAMDVIKSKRPGSALLLGSAHEGKVAFIALVPPELIERGLKAGDWVREAAKITGGGGGGRPDMAQAGGKDPQKLTQALQLAQAFAERTLEIP